METRIVNVSPQMATEWLEKNTFNRSISHHVVDKYASDMERGMWTLNHQGIAFDKYGVLVDGQHRLKAIVKSGKTIRMAVTFGSSRIGVDELRVRSAADVVKFGELSDWLDKKQIETAKAMMVLFQGKDRVFSTTQIVEFSEKNREAIVLSKNLFSKNVKGISTAAMRAVIAVAYYHFDHNSLGTFVESLYTGVVTDTRENAVIRLREKLLEGGFSGGGFKRAEMARKATRAVQAYMELQPMSKLVPQKNLAFDLPDDKRITINA